MEINASGSGRVNANKAICSQVTLRLLMRTKDPARFNALRREFLSLSFPDQAKLIGQYARLQLMKVDKIIKGNWPAEALGEKLPTALDVWNKWMEGKKWPDFGDKERMERAYPQLSKVSKEITMLLRSCYEYWLRNYYSCGENGFIDRRSAGSSRALSFGKAKMERIDRESGMDRLGICFVRDALLERAIADD